MYIIFEQNIYSAFSEPVRKVDQRIISASEIMDILRNSQWFLSQNVRDAINQEETHNV
jgi:hypothetical protein